jgi:hypothetical protein
MHTMKRITAPSGPSLFLLPPPTPGPSPPLPKHLNQYSSAVSLLLSSSLRMNHTKSSYDILPSCLLENRRGTCHGKRHVSEVGWAYRKCARSTNSGSCMLRRRLRPNGALQHDSITTPSPVPPLTRAPHLLENPVDDLVGQRALAIVREVVPVDEEVVVRVQLPELAVHDVKVLVAEVLEDLWAGMVRGEGRR